MNDDRGKKRMKDFQAPRYLVPIIVVADTVVTVS